MLWLQASTIVLGYFLCDPGGLNSNPHTLAVRKLVTKFISPVSTFRFYLRRFSICLAQDLYIHL